MNRFGWALGAGLLAITLVAGCADNSTGGDDLGLDDVPDTSDSGLGSDGDAAPTLTTTSTPDDQTDGEADAQTVETAIQGGAIEDLTIAAGTTVTWVNEDDEVRTLTSDDGTLNSGLISPGDTFEATFTEAGTWMIAVDDGAHAEITVQ